MTKFHLRLDEASKTPAQIEQRDATYAALKILRGAGVDAEVREFFTGSSKEADAAAIFLKMS